jgi:hypothetical protein
MAAREDERALSWKMRLRLKSDTCRTGQPGSITFEK